MSEVSEKRHQAFLEVTVFGRPSQSETDALTIIPFKATRCMHGKASPMQIYATILLPLGSSRENTVDNVQLISFRLHVEYSTAGFSLMIYYLLQFFVKLD